MTDRYVPVTVPGLTGVVALAAGQRHTCARRSDGTVACWGDNTFGALGDGSVVSRPNAALVPGLTGVVALAATFWGNCAARTDGSVVCWGYNVGADVTLPLKNVLHS
jgi:alpha-tubulin suppressor-like RCC1 family protein